MGIVGLPILLFIVLPLCYGVGSWILRPLRRARKTPPPRTQYQLTDLYILLGQLALLGVLFFGLGTGGGETPRLAGMLLGWAFFGWWWWLGIRALSRAKVRHPLRRAASLIFAMPLAYGAALPVFLFPLIAFSFQTGRGSDDLVEPALFWSLMIACGVWLLGSLLLFGVCRRLARWAAEEDQEKPATGLQKGLFAAGVLLLFGCAAAWQPIQYYLLVQRAYNTDDALAVSELANLGRWPEIRGVLERGRHVTTRRSAARFLGERLRDDNLELEAANVRCLVKAVALDPSSSVRSDAFEDLCYLAISRRMLTASHHPDGRPYTQADLDAANERWSRRRKKILKMIYETLDRKQIEALVQRLRVPQAYEARSIGSFLCNLTKGSENETFKNQLREALKALPPDSFGTEGGQHSSRTFSPARTLADRLAE